MLNRRELDNQLTRITELYDKQFVENKELRIEVARLEKENKEMLEIIEQLEKSVVGMQKELNKVPTSPTRVYVITYKFYEIINGKKRNLTAKISVESTSQANALKEFTKRVNGEPIAIERLQIKK